MSQWLFSVTFSVGSDYEVFIDEVSPGNFELSLDLIPGNTPYLADGINPIESGNTWNSINWNGTSGDFNAQSGTYNTQGWLISIPNSTNLNLFSSGGETFEGNFVLKEIIISVPCFTNTCNILTPSGFKNVSTIKEGDLVITSDKRIVKVQKVLTSIKSTYKTKPRLIKAHQYGKNLPIINTYLSDNHAYQVNKKWKLPCKANLPQQWHEGEDKITYYHLQLPDYFNDNLIVNGLVMEGWDGKMPYELKEFHWKQNGKSFERKLLH